MNTLARYVRHLLRVRRSRSAVIGLLLIGLMVGSAWLAPVLSPYGPTKQSLRDRLEAPSTAHWFGTDSYGRDILSRVLYGGRLSLTVGVLSVLIGVTFGSLAGIVAGYAGGAIDDVIMRLVDMIMSFPTILLAIVIVSTLGPGLTNAMIAIGVSSIPAFARVVRGTTLTAKTNDYVEAARSVGAGNSRILFRHILPNVVSSVTVIATLRLARSILTAATLSFLGLGVQSPAIDWGAMLDSGRAYMVSAWWVSVFPGVAIMIAVLGFNLLGDGIRDLLDPRLRGRL
jgi:peptide/nickel transport system permease protein